MEFFPAASDSCTDPSSYVSQLKSAMRSLHAALPRQPTQNVTDTSSSFAEFSHVFVRHDAVKKPLQQLYDGPYKVLKRNAKFFTLDRNGRSDTVSIDRLKPAHLDHLPKSATLPSSDQLIQPATTQPAHTTTRSGRRVHWPKRLANFVP